jgi:hypothetical protein
MVNVTVSVPFDMKKKMDEFGIINWSEVARAAFAEQIRKLELLKTLTSASKATDRDIETISEKIKNEVLKRHEGKR